MLISIDWDYYLASFNEIIAGSPSIATMEANLAQQPRSGSRPSEIGAHM